VPAESSDPPDLSPSETGSLSELLRKSRRGASFVYRPRQEGALHPIRYLLGQWRQILFYPPSSVVGIARLHRGEEGQNLLRLSHGAAREQWPGGGVEIVVPPKVELTLRDRPIRVRAVVRSDATYFAEAALGIAYFVGGRGRSRWHWFAVPKEWSIVEFSWVTPEKTGYQSSIAVRPGPQGTRGIDICQVTVSIGDPA